ncbi:LPXTG cell wall anchor domain-containing protein, partial [uncultured Aurantimicrobium sp.]|uniref:LPXTG cell wall anchor domain-containing protein n=1 Tax=uncultured Aurantimicrobium sp. TaxID=1705357 RepID=UPI002632975A
SASGVTLSAISNSNSYVPEMRFTFPTSQSGIVVVTFAPGAWVPSQINGTYPFKATTNGSDSYTVDVTVTGAKSTVFMNANIPNDYSMERQQASSPTALTANPFTRSGYSFAGWATSPTGAAVYADGAQFNFFGPTSFNQSGAITQLFAVWTQGSGGSGGSGGSSSSTPEVLANTGIDKTTGISLLAGGLSLALVGAEMFMIARRKRSN